MEEFKLKLKDHEKILFELLGNALFCQNNKVPFDDVDFKALWDEAYMQAVGLCALSNVSKGDVAEQNFLPLSAELSLNLAVNSRVNFEHTRIHQIMTKENIPYVIIKGLACAVYYPDPLMREMGDVDFLVKQEDIKRANEALIKNGFQLVKESHVCHFVYTANNCRYEMHFEPSGIPDDFQGEKIREYLKNAIDCAVEINTTFGTVCVPDKFCHGLILLLHMSHHLFGEGIGLRHLCDWAVFSSKMNQQEFCEIFEKKLKAIGIWKFACVMTQLSSQYLSSPQKEICNIFDGEALHPLISDILSSGNFGQKSPDRGHESWIVSSKTENSKSGSAIKSFIKRMNEIVYSHWKISRKIKLILPFGWLYFAGRYVFRSLFGKRPAIRPRKIISESKKRKNIYAQLELFKCE